MPAKIPLITILGPTATGKSDLAVWLAKQINGEVISADSRQVYKGLDIGSGKITKKEMLGVPHHLLDVANPKRKFSVVQYKKLATKAIADIMKRGKVPILVGGTGFYIDAIVYGAEFPEVKPDSELRKKLSQKTPEKLFAMLTKLDPERAANIDPHNPVRLIRAIEIVKVLGKVPRQKNQSPYHTLILGIDLPDEKLKAHIHKRLIARMKKGMVAEVNRLQENGLSWKRMNELGLEYRALARFLQKKISKEEILTEIKRNTWHYAKRQRTWFKRDKDILWLRPTDKKPLKRAVADFLKK